MDNEIKMDMNESYLQFHTKLIWNHFNKHSLPVYITENKKILFHGAYLGHKPTKIYTFEQLYAVATEHGIKIFDEIKPRLSLHYLAEILKQDKEIRNYFFKNSYDLVGPLRLDNVVAHLPKIKEQELYDLLNNKKVATIMLNTYSLNDFLDKVKSMYSNNMNESLTNFIIKHARATQSEEEISALKTTIVKYFPNELDKFNKIKFMRQYLQFNKKESSISIEENVYTTAYLKIDLNILKNKFLIPQASEKTYMLGLELLSNCLKSLKNSPIAHCIGEFSEISHNQKYYSLYVQVDKNYSFTTKELESIVKDYFQFAMDEPNIKVNNYHFIIDAEKTTKWLERRVFHDKLQKSVDSKMLASSSRRHKL